MKTVEDIVVVIVYTVMIVVIVAGNTLVIISFAKHRSLRTTTNVFLLNVAVADILTGLTSALLSEWCLKKPAVITRFV